MAGRVDEAGVWTGPSLGERLGAGVLRGRDELLAAVLEGRDLGRAWLRLSLVLLAGAALYGAVLGLWHGHQLALYVAIKLPLVLFLTSALTMLLSWVGSALLGLPLRFGQVAVLTFLGLAAASLLLASLAPVAWLFTVCAPPPTEEARTAHNLLYLLHTACVGGCGLAGTRVLWTAMGRLPDTPWRTRLAVYLLWVLAYALVGGEVAWVLRPFVGSVYADVVCLRPDALNGNVYEFIFTDILPHLFAID